MRRQLGVALLLWITHAAVATAQASPQAVYDSAYYAWDVGRYPEALQTFQRLLSATAGERYLKDVALLTGELYHTLEIAPDGTQPTWSPDGRFLAYETPSASSTGTVVAALDDGTVRIVAELDGTHAVFAPNGGEVAYLVLRAGSELDRARADAAQGIQVRNRADFARVRRALARVDAAYTYVAVRDLESGQDRDVATSGIGVFDVRYGSSGETMYLLANAVDDVARTDIYAVSTSGDLRRLTQEPGDKTGLAVVPGGNHLIYTIEGSLIGLLDLRTGRSQTIAGVSPTVSADGSTLAFIRRDGGDNSVHVMRIGSSPSEVARTTFRVDNPALSPTGDKVVYQVMPREDWELMVVGTDGSGARLLTKEIQHDLFPRFLTDQTVLAVIGEGRHRRSYLYHVDTGERTRLFHNNSIRTVAPEYEWTASPDGSKVLIVAERDGDTISPERGLYVVDLNRVVTRGDIAERIKVMLAAETDLRERGREMFESVAATVRAAVADVSTARIYGYEKDLYAFGSKFITQPGNAMAIEYIAAKLRSFGYEPELQWFEPRPGLRSANVIATLRGTVDPDLIYVLSSHFDSVERGPGSDDNTSGTTALLDAARVLAGRPQSATIKFAFFTGEEAGLLGSREFVRRAVAARDKIVGALNNDMVGFANNNRLDNTIRYSNAGIRDVQHAAAFLFTDLITYDAKYYKSTDAHAYYEAYGDIVGGIGSYPILGNPHYHQTHDVLETISHQLVAEVSKTTVATLVLLASSPSRLTDVEAERRGRDVSVRWTPAVESNLDGYIVAYGPEDEPLRQSVTVSEPQVTLSGVTAGTVVSVKAVNSRGMHGWDWARVVVP